MFKKIAENVIAFDAEWVPDPVAGRRVYGLDADMPDDQVVERMWAEGGATPEEPRPYLKTALCRVVSVAAVVRQNTPGRPLHLQLQSIPAVGEDPAPEGAIIGRFLAGVGRMRAQLVGFNSVGADIPILIQRGMAAGITAPEFCTRPDKPWEGVDYFVRHGEWSIDLMDVIGGWGKSNPSLHEIACVAGIPGKLGVGGEDVVGLWQQGQIERIVQYNQFDAITTYLLWLRLAHFAGLLSPEQYASEQEALERTLETEAVQANGAHLNDYLAAWREFRSGQLPTATP